MTNWTKLASVACVAVGVAGGGCANHKKKQSKVPLEPGVTDISPNKARPASSVPPDPSFVYVPAAASQPKFVPVDAPAPMPAAFPTPMSAPITASMATPAAEAAAPAAPVAPVAPAIVTRTPAAHANVPALDAGPSQKYLVQKGDTLFRIAKTRYGDGNRWQQIASANPGLTPSSLRAGATIVVP